MTGLFDDCLGAVLGPLCEILFKADSYGIFDALQSLKRGQAPALKTGYKGVIARSIASHCPNTSGCCSTAFTFVTWQSRPSEWVASALGVASDSSWRRTALRFSCEAKEARASVLEPMLGRVYMRTTANELLLVSV